MVPFDDGSPDKVGSMTVYFADFCTPAALQTLQELDNWLCDLFHLLSAVPPTKCSSRDAAKDMRFCVSVGGYFKRLFASTISPADSIGQGRCILFCDCLLRELLESLNWYLAVCELPGGLVNDSISSGRFQLRTRRILFGCVAVVMCQDNHIAGGLVHLFLIALLGLYQR